MQHRYLLKVILDIFNYKKLELVHSCIPLGSKRTDRIKTAITVDTTAIELQTNHPIAVGVQLCDGCCNSRVNCIWTANLDCSWNVVRLFRPLNMAFDCMIFWVSLKYTVRYVSFTYHFQWKKLNTTYIIFTLILGGISQESRYR